ncbi:hypothetical protein AHAS_Ahas10G0149500 [Arachis hypogaea]
MQETEIIISKALEQKNHHYCRHHSFVANIKFGDLSQFGIPRPNKGPFYLKEAAGRSPILDVGTIAMIKDGAIKVISSHIMRIENNKVIFGNKTEKEFNAIVFATGYKSVANKWLKDNYKNVLNEDGMPKNAFSMPFTLKTIICSKTRKEVANACPFCSGNCNCKACLREDREVNSRVKLHRLRYLLYKALPVLRHIHREQSLELEIESKVRGEQLQEKGIARTELDKRYDLSISSSVLIPPLSFPGFHSQGWRHSFPFFFFHFICCCYCFLK